MYAPGGQKLGAYLFVPGTTTQNGLDVAMINVTLSSSDQYFGSRRLAVLDQLGSAGNNGASLGTYYPWGEVKGSTNPQNTWGFATYWQDSVSGLDYAHNRYYSNGYGRFTSPDPSRSSGGPNNPQSWNRYAYVSGDPVNLRDPGGLMEEEVCAGEDGDPCDGGGGDGGFGGCDASQENCDDPCVGADGFTASPNPYCQGSAPPTQTTTAVPACNTDFPKIDTTLNNLGQDILGITSQKDGAITAGEMTALQQTIGTDILGELANPLKFFNGGHFSLNLGGGDIASDLGGTGSLAYQDFEQIFNPGKNGKRYTSPVPTTDPNHTYYLHDHAQAIGNNLFNLSFHFDQYNPYHPFGIGAILHGAVDVLYGHLGVHCLDPAWR